MTDKKISLFFQIKYKTQQCRIDSMERKIKKLKATKKNVNFGVSAINFFYYFI